MAYFLEKEKTGSTPYVLIDEEKGYMKFEGESFHENVIEFFGDINNWLSEYLETDFGKFTFDCELEYFNSSTAKLLLNIIFDIDEHTTEKNKTVINWITSGDNEIITECGEDFKEEVENTEFNIIVKLDKE